jgi:hypothetical protein
MKNVTASMMGDPEAQARRSPTQKERIGGERREPRPCQDNRARHGSRARVLFAMKVGDELPGQTKNQAIMCCAYFRSHGKLAAMTTQRDGTFTITRRT